MQSQFKRYWSIITRGKILIFTILACVVIPTIIYTFTVTPQYEATARVLIDINGAQSTFAMFDYGRGFISNKITNEIENLKSHATIEAVAVALVNTGYLDEARTETIPLLYETEDSQQGAMASLLEIGEALEEAVDFSPMRDSDVIKITARSTEPREAALIANTFAMVFAERNLDASRAKSKALREFLQSQLEVEQTELNNAERELQSYMRNSGMVTLDAEAKRVIEQLADLEARRDALEVEITSVSNTLSSYKQQLAIQEPHVAKSIEQSNDAYVRILQDQLATLEVQRDVFVAENPSLAGRTTYNQKLSEIEGQIAALKKNLQDRTKEFLLSVQPGDARISTRDGSAGFIAQLKQRIIEQQIDLDALTARKGALDKVITNYEAQFNLIPRKSIQLAKLQRTSMSNEKLYLMIQEKYNEAAIAEKSEFGNVEIMDPAVSPLKPIRPVVWLNLVLSVLLGAGLGVAVVLLRAEMDIRLRDPDDLKRLGHPPLSTIARMHPEPTNGEMESAASNGEAEFKFHLMSHLNPLSPVAESYRYLQANIQLAHLNAPLKSILVTSPNPKEGKTTTAINLAITFAQAERNVLLIDADVRRPVLHTVFALNKEPGLIDYLSRKVSFNDIVHETNIERLHVVPSGASSRNPASVFASADIESLLQSAGRKYDIVLFDSPPLHAVTDAAILSTRVGSTIVVVSAGETKEPSFVRAIESLTEIGGTLLGVVLNNYDVRKALRGGYGVEGYGYYSYGYSGSSNGKSRKAIQA